MIYPHFSIIAAIGKNRVIGKDNNLLWRLKDDLKLFKETTSGHTVVMGRKTFESIGSKPLPNRQNIIISKNLQTVPDSCILYSSPEQFIADFSKKNEEIFILGGGNIYEQFLPLTGKMYISFVDVALDGDTFFPSFENSEWNVTEQKEFPKNERNQYSFTFKILKRK